MRNHKMLISAVTLSLAALSAASVASPPCTQVPKSKWLSQEAIAAKLKEQGYEVSRMKTEGSCYEVKGRDAQGRRVELYVDPVAAQIVRRKSRDRS